MISYVHSTSEIPQYRLPISVVNFEISLVQDLGVRIERGRSLSTKDLTVSKLLDSGSKAVFVGIGLPEAKPNPVFEGLTAEMGFYTSKSFLPRVSEASKPGKGILRLLINMSFFTNSSKLLSLSL